MSPRRPKPNTRRGDRKGGPPGRRTPPPEATGLEARYLQYQSKSETKMRIRLRDGQALEGIIRGFDRDVLTVEPAVGEAVTIRKSEIRYVEEPDDA
jgi:hypothetical protein